MQLPMLNHVQRYNIHLQTERVLKIKVDFDSPAFGKFCDEVRRRHMEIYGYDAPTIDPSIILEPDTQALRRCIHAEIAQSGKNFLMGRIGKHEPVTFREALEDESAR